MLSSSREQSSAANQRRLAGGTWKKIERRTHSISFMPNMVKRYKILNAKQCTMCSSGAGKCACIIFCASFVRLFICLFDRPCFFYFVLLLFSRLCQYLTEITTFFHSHIFHIATCHASICEKARKNKCSLIVCGTRPGHHVFFVLALPKR